MFIRSLY